MMPDGSVSALLMVLGVSVIAFAAAFSFYAGVIAASKVFGALNITFRHSRIDVCIGGASGPPDHGSHVHPDAAA
jgi:hypothetical protein